jgi:hypothetical protein
VNDSGVTMFLRYKRFRVLCNLAVGTGGYAASNSGDASLHFETKLKRVPRTARLNMITMYEISRWPFLERRISKSLRRTVQTPHSGVACGARP